ncbi:GIY-YIG nuclease family protein [Candidatus Gracilibacteria bacterium]|nr:GIY-YIG nuclease family protein [Candidatus Gracilibacteria bacterium]MCF7819239.1 GIY-YIG nuclease family protein [Candidatus Gracilibacteria bacterium]
MDYTVYVLQSLKDKKYYIGQTNDFNYRIQCHNEGLVKSTKHRKPFILIHKEIYKTRSEAMKREQYLKSLKGGNGWKSLLYQWK